MQIAQWTASVTLMATLLLNTQVQAQIDVTHATIYQHAGLDQQLANIWQEVSSEYAGLPKEQSDEKIDINVGSLIEKEFSEIQLRKNILSYWEEHLALSDLTLVSDWLSSPLGQKITLAEVNATLGHSDTAMSDYLEGLRDDPPSKSRIDLLRLLDKSVRASEASVELGINIHLAALAALHATGQNPKEAESIAQAAQSLERDRGLLNAMIRQDVLKYNLFAYRNINDESLREYIAFATSPSGFSFHKSTFFAVKNAMILASEELQQHLQGQQPEAMTTH